MPKRHVPDSCSQLFSNQVARTKSFNKKANVTENKSGTSSLWKAFYDSKRRLHFFNKQPVYKQLTLSIKNVK